MAVIRAKGEPPWAWTRGRQAGAHHTVDHRREGCLRFDRVISDLKMRIEGMILDYVSFTDARRIRPQLTACTVATQLLAFMMAVGRPRVTEAEEPDRSLRSHAASHLRWRCRSGVRWPLTAANADALGHNIHDDA